MKSCSRRFHSFGILSAFMCAAVGCSGGEESYVIGSVSGLATLDDAPLMPGCVVIFNPAEGKTTTGSALVKEGGAYEISRAEGKLGVPVGKYKVTISPPALDPEARKQSEQKNLSVMAKAMATKNPGQATKMMKENMEVPQTDIVPLKYWSTGTTPLNVTVEKGVNTANFALTSKK